MAAEALEDEKQRGLTKSIRDLLVIGLFVLLTWLFIERFKYCDDFFRWVADNPEYEADSILLALIFSAFGSAVFAWRRYGDMKSALAQRNSAEEHVRKMAYEDPLTGLPNRRALVERLDKLAASPLPNSNFALTILDLDKFKAVNDTYGHAEGDALLALVSKRIAAHQSANAEVYRLGGDEFAIISLPSSQLEDDLDSMMTAVLGALREPFSNGKFMHHIGSSAGTALFPRDGFSTALLRAADVAMYKAKEAGGGRHEIYAADMDRKARERVDLESQIRAGVAEREFVAHYQPIVDLSTGKLRSLELLARWQRPDKKIIGPDVFIPIAENNGLITDIMLQMLEQFCLDARHWPDHISVAINLSAVQFKDNWLGQKILAVLVKHGMAPRRISVEITETAIVSDEEAAIRTISSLRNQGVNIALDDFGTGYSSLHYLRTIPFDKLKIDRSFILTLLSSQDSEKIVSAVIGLGNNLGLTVVAEGIETREAAEKLFIMGCSEGQGYFFGRPADAASISRLFETSKPVLEIFNETDEETNSARGAA